MINGKVMKKFFFLIAIIASMWQVAEAQDTTDVGNNKILWVQNFPGNVYDCAFMPDEDYIIVAHDTILEVRKTVDQSLVRYKVMNEGVIYSLDVSKDGKYVAIGGGSILKLLDINTFDVIKDYKKGTSMSLSLSPDGKYLAFACYKVVDQINPSIKKGFVIDVESEEVLFEFGLPDTTAPWNRHSRIENIKFSPDGRWLACNYQGGEDKRVFVFDTKNWELYYGFNHDDHTPNGANGEQILFTPNSKTIILQGANGKVFRAWDIESKTEIISPECPTGHIKIVLNNETIFISDNIFNSFFYNFRNGNRVRLNIYPPFGNCVLNKGETLILGDLLALMQLDKSILSVNKSEESENQDLLIPNPATNEVFIKTNLPYNDLLLVNIQDLTGKTIEQIYNKFTSKGAFELNYNISHLNIGSYFITILQRDFIKTFKLIREGK